MEIGIKKEGWVKGKPLNFCDSRKPSGIVGLRGGHSSGEIIQECSPGKGEGLPITTGRAIYQALKSRFSKTSWSTVVHQLNILMHAGDQSFNMINYAITIQNSINNIKHQIGLINENNSMTILYFLLAPQFKDQVTTALDTRKATNPELTIHGEDILDIIRQLKSDQSNQEDQQISAINDKKKSHPNKKNENKQLNSRKKTQNPINSTKVEEWQKQWLTPDNPCFYCLQSNEAKRGKQTIPQGQVGPKPQLGPPEPNLAINHHGTKMAINHHRTHFGPGSPWPLIATRSAQLNPSPHLEGNSSIPPCTPHSRLQEWSLYGIIYHYAPFLLRNSMVTFSEPNPSFQIKVSKSNAHFKGGLFNSSVWKYMAAIRRPFKDPNHLALQELGWKFIQDYSKGHSQRLYIISISFQGTKNFNTPWTTQLVHTGGNQST
ncbi:hypothetical protein O181_058403, partial [Austropuccinia psidii MF-1]|nr:hypothetical protein [Austropuccinia psidii MF-1]